MKKYWFYFGVGIKKGQTVTKNGMVGAECDTCPIIEIENSVMEEDQCPQFHVAYYKEVSEEEFLQFKKNLNEPRPHIVEPKSEDLDMGSLGNPIGSMIGGLLGGSLGVKGDSSDDKEQKG